METNARPEREAISSKTIGPAAGAAAMAHAAAKVKRRPRIPVVLSLAGAVWYVEDR